MLSFALYMNPRKYPVQLLLTIASTLFLITPFMAQAANAWPYAPGATTDPACLPTDSTCTVSSVTASGTVGQVPFYASAGSILAATSTLTILQNGNVGIGTTSPFANFSVAGNAYVSGTMTVDNLVTSNGPQVNVMAYGAKGDGVTDDSAAFNAAIASLGGNGGTIIVPSGKFAINILITQPNVRIEGQSAYGGNASGSSSSAGVKFVPYNTALPVIQIGNDSGYVNGVALDNFGINGLGPNGYGTTGLYLAGGAIRNYFTNVQVQNFTSYGIKLMAGTTYPTSENYFTNLIVQMPSAQGIAGIGLYYPTGGSYTTANYFSNVNVTSGNSGYAIEIDGADGNFSNMWVQVGGDNHGIHFLSTSGHATHLYASNVNVDGPGPSSKDITIYNTDGVLSDFMTGTYTVSGDYQLSDGSSYKVTGTGALGYQSAMSWPIVDGSLSFANGSNYAYSNLYNINANSNELLMQSDGNLRFVASTTNGSQSMFNTGITAAGSVTVNTGSVVLDNTYAYREKDNGGNSVGLIGMSSTNNVGLSGSTVSGSMQFSVPNSSGGYQFFTGPSSTNVMQITNSGNVAIGTTSPAATLTVWAPSTAASTTPVFLVSNNASTTLFQVYDSGNATYSGAIYQSSDKRLKTNITPLDASSSLAAILGLTPVSYTRLDQPGGGTNLGFLAQDVQQIFPELVATTSPTALTPNGTLTLNYIGLISPIVRSIQALASEVGGFAQSITTAVLNATTVNTQKLCVGTTCIDQAQLASILANQGQGSGNSGASTPKASCTLTASSTSVAPGDRTILSWNFPQAGTFSIDQGIGSVSPALSGTTTSEAINADTTFTGTGITATGATITCSTSVSVMSRPLSLDLSTSTPPIVSTDDATSTATSSLSAGTSLTSTDTAAMSTLPVITLPQNDATSTAL